MYNTLKEEEWYKMIVLSHSGNTEYDSFDRALNIMFVLYIVYGTSRMCTAYRLLLDRVGRLAAHQLRCAVETVCSPVLPLAGPV